MGFVWCVSVDNKNGLKVLFWVKLFIQDLKFKFLLLPWKSFSIPEYFLGHFGDKLSIPSLPTSKFIPYSNALANEHSIVP